MSRKRREALILAIEKEVGENSEELVKQLLTIARGQAIKVPSSIPGVVRELTPTVAEVSDACMNLLAYHYGKPNQPLEVEEKAKRTYMNVDLLSLEELQEMDRIARKAQKVETPTGDPNLRS